MNNPFFNANDPSHASSRYPDISGGSPSHQQQQQGQWSNPGTSYQQQQTGYGQQFQQQPQLQYGQQGYGGGGYLSPTGSTMQSPYNGGSQFYQPNNSYGQQSGPVMSGTSYSYLSGQLTGMPQQMQQQQQQLGPAQQQIANNPGYVAQFDPYGPLGSWDGGSGQNQQQQQYQQAQQQQQGYQNQNGYDTSQYLIPPTGPTPGVSPNGDPHPKEFVRTHKAMLDKWDAFTWKQLLNTFEALKNAWGSRKTACSSQLEGLKAQLNFAGYYQQQVQAEIQRVQELVKDADQKFDSVAASTFQMQEVFQGYRQSPDVSSKALVREATNASLNGLPDWPPSSI
ncbi:hypothetical protein BKA70DRAFT_1558498 [Coprinopsis sp. MPI-PUGE-AT-0042]|nr:hypothetical protein BKA70DRAFT_1558498 [Coprinopsis sp. MPI-PUGE-AT-0042]